MGRRNKAKKRKQERARRRNATIPQNCSTDVHEIPSTCVHDDLRTKFDAAADGRTAAEGDYCCAALSPRVGAFSIASGNDDNVQTADHELPADSLLSATTTITTPTSLASKLLGHGLIRADAHGRRDGNWVFDCTIVELLDFLGTEGARSLTFRQQRYDVRVCYVDCATHVVHIPDAETTNLPCNQLVLVIHTSDTIQGDTRGYHFSVFVINTELQLVHVFDTLGRWTDQRAWETLHSQFPSLCSMLGSYSLHNHTGRLRQQMATCGAWSLWICYAYAVNFGGCRVGEEDYQGLDLRPMQADAAEFWWRLTR